MHILLGLVAVLGAVAVWYWRYQMARQAGSELIDAANDVRLAAKRFAYRRKRNVHPADAVKDTRLAASGIALATASIDGPLSKAELEAMAAQARAVFAATTQEAEEIAAFGRWIAGQCSTPEEAQRRLIRVIVRQAGGSARDDLLRMVRAVASADGAALNERQEEVLTRIERAFA